MSPTRPERKLERRTVRVAGLERSYLLGAGPTAPTGIVLSLHGRGTTARVQAWLSRMARLTGEGAIVVFPQGSIRSDRRGFDWAEEAELDYLSAVIEAIRTEFPGADRRVCLAGMSAGARMACRYAAARAEEVAAVGAVAGLRAPPTEPSQPVPVVAFHGLADRSISYLSGQGRYRTGSIPAAARAWAIANALEAKRSELRISPTLTKTSYGEGSPGEVTLWTFAGADQTWPGGAGALVLRPFLGRTSKELDASEEIWRFFRRHLADGG